MRFQIHKKVSVLFSDLVCTAITLPTYGHKYGGWVKKATWLKKLPLLSFWTNTKIVTWYLMKYFRETNVSSMIWYRALLDLFNSEIPLYPRLPIKACLMVERLPYTELKTVSLMIEFQRVFFYQLISYINRFILTDQVMHYFLIIGVILSNYTSYFVSHVLTDSSLVAMLREISTKNRFNIPQNE